MEKAAISPSRTQPASATQDDNKAIMRMKFKPQSRSLVIEEEKLERPAIQYDPALKEMSVYLVSASSPKSALALRK
jgi:hypothetical protein